MFSMLGSVSAKAWPSSMHREVKGSHLAGQAVGKPFKIQLCFIGFGTNTFFETLWRLIVDRRKWRVMISHDLFFFFFLLQN